MIKYNIFENGNLILNDKNQKSYNFKKTETLFIFHGLYGRARNWQSIAKELSNNYLFTIITVDLRNHGENKFEEDHSYSLMAKDIIELFQFLNIKRTNILGHSMGGKLAMILSIKHPQCINKLIIADIAPISYENNETKIIDALINLDLNLIKTRNDADNFLSKEILDKSLRLFLLQNLKFTDNNLRWTINLKAIKNSLNNLKAFPEFNKINKFNNKTLCVYGANSNYVNENNLTDFNIFFTDMSFKKIEGAGHWLHAEKPKEFIYIITQFLNN